ncbi:hypothetical protein JOF56_008342 [Kibdelosporangium banguiense]|uniref:DUF2264 domain-containing protein n=1 Tax=Kibdelosporangium banguiense TaxID=1365924 RepID=A0ABS4TU83_9PSEU|nr:DUF2264 domain-containing protein [Kibdelosporangium banguiense]MBP2327957.1 hypothetical protein [Kibdelosporangium banguiense]
MPPEDRIRSSYTGWTREHWVAVADRMLNALEPHWSPSGARIDLPGPPSRNGVVSDGLEGFARTFMLAGFRVAGEHGADPGGLLERYARGLAAGTDPASPEAWPRPDELGQAKVEAASIALVLQMTRPWLWDRLDDVVRERVAAWLGTVVGQVYPPINWVWFRIVVESFLREAGGPWSAEDIEQDLAVHQSLRRADGWLSDGQERSYDHYTGWALHTYPLLWTHLFDVTGSLCSQELRDQWSADLARYLEDAAILVGADGSPLMQGRSLAYRFAAAAPFWVGALTGTGGQEPGLVRRVASGMLRHFVDHGAVEPDGLLRLGWYGEWPAIRQSYSGPGSPYWAAKGMLGLAVPADHPLWTDTECPLPVEKGDTAHVIKAPGWLVSARHDTGVVTVVNHGTDHALPGDTRSDAPMYARLAYSTATMPPLVCTQPVDNSVGLLDENGLLSHRAGFRTLFLRELPGGVLAGASCGTVRWVDTSADDSPDHGSGRTGPVRLGPSVLVASVIRDGVEIRLARVDGETPSPLRLSGWSVTGDRRPDTEVEAGPWIAVNGVTLRSGLCGLHGFDHAGVDNHADASPLGAFAATPWLATAASVLPGHVLVAAVWLDRGGARPAIPVVAVERDVISLRWSDGLHTQVTLPNP